MKTAGMFRIMVVAVGLVLAALAGPAEADTYYVDPNGFKDFTTIQDAISFAFDYDEIEVAPGTYNEAIDFLGKAVRLYSSGGWDVTTIDANGAYHVVKCVSGEDANTILEGFTITGGMANGTDPNDKFGGGMYNGNSSPTVTDCKFSSNSAYYGAGMYCDSSSPTVTNCIFSDNTVAGFGGGMYNDNSSPTVTNCRFSSNSTGYHAGGMYNVSNSNPNVTNCIFTGNTAANDGGGMFNNGSSPTVTNCIFYGNKAQGGTYYNAGGGMYNYDNSDPTLTNCTFYGNVAEEGGGIYNYDSQTVTNCILWGNAGVEISGKWGTVNYSCLQGTLPPGTGNINADPLFVDAGGGNLRVELGSPCVDAGDNNSVPAGVTTDLDGNPRVVDGDRDGNDIVDMGAYELPPPSVIINITRNNWYITIQAAIDDANDGDQIKVAPGTYNEAIDFLGKAVRLYSSGGPEVTTIDASGLNWSVVTCNSGEDANTILEGFTITGGDATYGGGMYCESSSPTVTTCSFTGNSSKYAGGGMYNDNSNPTVTNCTFSENVAYFVNIYEIFGSGGGMFNTSSSPTVTNCILWGDTPQEIYDDGSSSTTVNYSDVEGGWGGTGSDNIDADPLFVNVAGGDLRLASYASPCVDAGNNSIVTEPNDLAGSPRIVDGDEDGTATVDMGAYEYGEYGVHNVTQNALYITIQAAIDDANDGDEIEVAPGTYYEAIDFLGKAVRLYSIGGPNDTTIDGTGNYHVVKCVSGEDADTILEGFTITGGNANGSGYDRFGGGMYDSNSSPTVTDCNFSGNSAEWGGGMANQYSSPTVTNCIFSGNTAANDGGGMYNYPSSGPMVTNCIFTDNTAANYGGGMSNGQNSFTAVTNCTFTGNTAANYGGGMSNYDNSNPILTNCILWGNTAPTGTQIYGMAVVEYSDVEGGWTGTGNIDANPIFRNVDKGNVSLVPWSPCIDAGNNAVVGPNAVDITGLPRLADGDCDTTVTVDMGAHELQHTYMSDFDSTCLVDWVDFAGFALAWLSDPLSENWDPVCDIGIPADGRIDCLDLKVFAENWLDHADTSITCDAAVLNHVFGLDPVTIFDILGAAPCSFSPGEIIEAMKEGGCPMLELVEIDANTSGQPVIPGGFHALGSYSFTAAGCQFAARELLPGTLASPLDYEQVCDLDFWKPVAPPGYVSLGLVASGVKPGLDDVKCVKEELTCAGDLGALGGGQLFYFDPWPPIKMYYYYPTYIVPEAYTDGIYIGTFRLTFDPEDYCPQDEPLYVLDARVVQKPEYLTLQDIDQLIQDYGPVLMLYAGEDYLPDDPEWVLDNGVKLQWGLVENESDYDTFTQTYVDSMTTSSATLMDDVEYVLNSIKPNPPYNSSESFKYWLNIPDGLKPGSLSRAKSLVRVVPWNHFFTEIQFWFFYPFNGPGRVRICLSGWDDLCEGLQLVTSGRHYGDWEHVTLRFLNSSKELVSVYMSAHSGGHWFDDGDFGDTLQFLGLHPKVYSGKYSHAHYPTAGTHYYDRISEVDYWFGTFSVDLYDVTTNGLPFLSYLVDNYSVVSYDVYPVPTPDWLGFTSRWGQYEKLSTSFGFDVPIYGWYDVYTYAEVGAGPSGPPRKRAWQVGDSQEALTTK